MLGIIFMRCLESCPDVFSRRITDNVVDGVEDIAAALGQDINALLYLRSNDAACFVSSSVAIGQIFSLRSGKY